MSTQPGVGFREESRLLEAALELLERGPVASEELAARVLGIRGGPAGVAERLVHALLNAEPRVRRGEGGVWVLAGTAPAPEIGFDEIGFAVVDVETTGGVAGRGGRMIEIAIVAVERREIADVYATLVDPGVALSPWITRLTGIRNGMVREAPRFSEVCDDITSRLRGRVFVAHNVGFDWGFVREELRQVGAAVPRGPRLCTVQLTRRLLPGLDRRGLDAVAKYYGIEIEERHRARGDAIATARILLRMLEDAERKGWETWPLLQAAMARSPSPRRGT